MALHGKKSADDKSWFGNLVPSSSAFGDMMENSRDSFEDGFRSFSKESLDFFHRRNDHNNETIDQCRDCKSVSSFLSAQQKWFSDLTHDFVEAATRMNEVSRKLFADGISKNNILMRSYKAGKHGQKEAD